MQRDLGTFRSLKVNNFFFFIALLVAGELQSGLPPWGALPFIGLMSLPLLLPVSADPLDKIPAERLALWPMTVRQRVVLRLMSLALSPVFWFMALIVLKTARIGGALAFAALAIAARALAGSTKRVPNFNILRSIPLLRSRLGGILTNNLREMLSILDTWVAVLLSAVSIAYRLASHRPDPAALPILSMLIALALSTYAQSLFGLDFGSGTTLYRLLPLRGWEILLAKDAAFLGLLLALTIALAPLSALTFGLASLAIGHHSSVMLKLPQMRWRFAGGRLLPVGALQVLVSVFTGFAEMRRGAFVLVAVASGYLLSLWFYGRKLPDMPGH